MKSKEDNKSAKTVFSQTLSLLVLDAYPECAFSSALQRRAVIYLPYKDVLDIPPGGLKLNNLETKHPAFQVCQLKLI